MSIRSRLGAIRHKILLSLHGRRIPLGDLGPVVTFSFDDFPRSAYLVGGAILEKYGARGTYYASAGFLNTSNQLGELLREEDLRALVEKGHELGTQTFHHKSCRSASLAAFRDEVQEGTKAVERLTGHNSTNFAYPYGHVTLRVKKTLGPELTSSRSVIPGLNGPEIDLNLLRANPLYGDVDLSQRIEDLILQNVKEKNWLIFYTHDVRPNPSEYGCTPELLEFAVSTAAKSGSKILTVDKVLSEILPGGKHEL